METDKLTVAIELGSSKISGAAGYKQADGLYKVMAYAATASTSCIHHGAVYNLDKTANAIVEVINKLENQLNAKVKQVVIGYNCQSIKSIYSTVSRHFDEETIVTSDVIDQMFSECEDQVIPGYEKFHLESQEYGVNNKKSVETEPIGIACNDLVGNYLNIVLKSQIADYIGKCFGMASVEVLDGYVTPLAEADVALTDEEKRQGCVLVDYGAETTTVSVYHNGMLRYLRVLPFGSSLITKDLATVLQIEPEEAEKLKVTYGLCNIVNNQENSDTTMVGNKKISLKDVGEIIEARNEEILRNIAHQIKASGLYDILYSGIILTGGGSNLRRLDEAFVKIMPTLRTPRIVCEPIDGIEWAEPRWRKNDGSQLSLLAIMFQNQTNCCEFPTYESIDDITPEQEKDLKTAALFDENGESAQRERDRREEERRNAEVMLKQKQEQEKKEESTDETNTGSKKKKNYFKKLFDRMMQSGEDFFEDVQ
jgi:cell division protein FtsA